MNRSSVSIANAHDGIALTAEEATQVANVLSAMNVTATTFSPERHRLLGSVIAILRGKRSDGSEPEEQGDA